MNKLEQIKFIEENFPLESKHCSKRKLRHSFFENIKTEVQAYLLGFFAADGNINDKRKTLRVQLHVQDSDIVDMYRDLISPDARVFKTQQSISVGRNGKTINASPTYGIDICSSKLCYDIINCGFGYRKTYCENFLPNIDANLVRHFIRGYFDGDGCITGNYCKAIPHHNERIRMYFQIDFKTKSLACEMNDWFNNNGILTHIIYLKRDDM